MIARTSIITGLKGRAARVACALAVALAATASAAQAADLCVDYLGSGGVRTIVGKRFKVPKSGQCTVLQGFSSYQGGMRTVSGPVCASTDGTHMTFGLTGVSGNVALYYSIDLPLPLSGGQPGSISVYTNTGAMQLVSDPHAGPCNPSPQPVP